MAKAAFQIPDFLQNQSREAIHRRMMAMLPDSWDKSEGQFPYEFTMPTASEKAEMAQFILVEALKSAFSTYAEGTMLDYHAAERGITRKPPAYASGYVLVTGVEGAEIPKGFQFTTASDYNRAGIPFETTEPAGMTGAEVRVPVKAMNPGTVGNVAANVVIFMNTPMVGITSIRNPEAMTGGIDEETDEALHARVDDYNRNQGLSYIGNVSDYRRWAMEVQGVGNAQIVLPEDGSGIVTIILLDAAGEPAQPALCKAVYDHIMRPDNPEARLTPPNSIPHVIPPTTVLISITATIKTDGTATLPEIRSAFQQALKLYYKSAGLEIRWAHIGAILLDCAGVLDYGDLTVNGGIENIRIAAGNMAVTGNEEIALTVGELL